MKKFSILGLCLVAGLTMSAQMDLVKDVERAVKAKEMNIYEFDYSTVSANVDAMLTNEESMNNSKTWYVAGLAKFADYQSQLAKSSLGQTMDSKNMAKALVDGYDYMFKALSLDTIVDDKGKVKTKESKKIVNAIVDNYQNLFGVGGEMLNANEYQLTYNALNYYLNLPQDNRFASKLKDNVNTEYIKYAYYYRAFAAVFIEKYEQAWQDSQKAIELGVEDKVLYDVALNSALALQDMDKVLFISEKAHQIYGKEDLNYVKNIVEAYVFKNEYAKAKEFVNQLITAEPDNAEYVMMLAEIYNKEGNKADAIATYRKATQVDPYSAVAHLNLGLSLLESVTEIELNASAADEARVRKEVTLPMINEAISALETAYKLDEVNMGRAKNALIEIYRQLGDVENEERAKNL